ncbi:MAG: hypothetical protein AB1606_04435 [Nitrospirota bacterium]
MSVEEVSNITNAEFWGRYLKRGAVGLVGGTTWIHKAIREAEALITPDKKPSVWAHAFIFTGRKPDGHEWIAESSLITELHKMQIINGAQENRIDSYYGTKTALNCAVLDFGLSDADADKVIGKALDMVAKKIMYPVSGLIGTLFAYLFKTEKWRNLWNTKNALYCSAFVQEAYFAVGIDLAPATATTNTSPEHLWQTKVSHKAYLLRRE